MRNFLRKLVIGVMLVVTPVMVTTGCRKQTSVTTPGAVAVNPEYKLTQGLAILVEANKAATQVVIQLNGNKTLTDADTAMILGYNSMVASSAKAALVSLDSQRPLAEKAAAVRAAMTKVSETKTVSAYLVANKDNPKLQAVLQTLNTVQLLIVSVVSEAH